MWKALRYEMYTLEKAILLAQANRSRFEKCCLYVLVTESDCHHGSGPAIRGALAAGAKAVQLREKQMPVRRFLDYAAHVREWTRKAGALLIVNDRPDLAVLLDADGVHVGQDDLRVARSAKNRRAGSDRRRVNAQCGAGPPGGPRRGRLSGRGSDLRIRDKTVRPVCRFGVSSAGGPEHFSPLVCYWGHQSGKHRRGDRDWGNAGGSQFGHLCRRGSRGGGGATTVSARNRLKKGFSLRRSQVLIFMRVTANSGAVTLCFLSSASEVTVTTEAVLRSGSVGFRRFQHFNYQTLKGKQNASYQ